MSLQTALITIVIISTIAVLLGSTLNDNSSQQKQIVQLEGKITCLEMGIELDTRMIYVEDGLCVDLDFDY